MNDTTETWKRVIRKGVELNYDVSTLGRVRNATTKRVRRTRLTNGKTTKYRAVTLYDRGTRKLVSCRIAALVADAFLRPRLPGEQIEHADQNSLNDRLDNLLIVTQSENISRSYDLGTRRLPSRMRYLTPEQHARIRELWETGEYTQVRLAGMFDTTNATVSRIVSGHRKPRIRRATADGKCTGCPRKADAGYRTCTRCRSRNAAKIEGWRRKHKPKRAALMRAWRARKKAERQQAAFVVSPELSGEARA